MKKLLLILLVASLGFAACQTQTTEYQNADLLGTWLRVKSSDPRSDSMAIKVKYDSASNSYYAIVYNASLLNPSFDSIPSSSDFNIGQTKWSGIREIPRTEGGDFEIYDLSADGKSWRALLTLPNTDSIRLANTEYPGAPGGVQEWVRK